MDHKQHAKKKGDTSQLPPFTVQPAACSYKNNDLFERGAEIDVYASQCHPGYPASPMPHAKTTIIAGITHHPILYQLELSRCLIDLQFERTVLKLRGCVF